MRSPHALLLALATFSAFAAPVVSANAQTCTGLCLQQEPANYCPNSGTTTITGTVYAPNGTDPLPDVLVYVPNAPVDAFTPGVSCPLPGAPPSGSPLVGATTAFDGTFTISNMPVGANIPLVIQTGRWRRQIVIPMVSACANTVITPDQSRMPRNKSEGDIPMIAVSTGSADQVECVLRKVGIDDAEFTNPGGTGRINLYSAVGSPGALIDSSTPDETALMGNAATLNSYDVLMLPCEGGIYAKPSGELANLIGFANSGGRVYASHYSFDWMYQNPPFSSVVSWTGKSVSLADGDATVDQTFSEGITLAQWLQLVGASTTPGQIAISTLRRDFTAINPASPTNPTPAQSYLALNLAAQSNPVMQFVFDTPVGQATGQCGRVLFNEYHVETTTGNTSQGVAFPAECNTTTTALTPQEKLLEFSLFELTADGAAATLTPATADFGTEPIGFNSPAQTFTWTNNSSFSASVSLVATTGDFAQSNNCSAVKSGASCQIQVVFNPTVTGARTGTLSVGSGNTTLISTLTGTGIPALNFSLASLTFGSQDVGYLTTQNVIVTNAAPGPVTVPAIAITGDFSVASTCGSTLAQGANCTLAVSFKPSTTGPRTGIMTVGTNAPTALSGNGIDFTIGLTPTSGNVIAGYSTTTESLLSPLAGFNTALKVTCTTTTPGTTCAAGSSPIDPAAPIQDQIAFTTTSQYTVVGYGGAGRFGLLWLLALGSGCLLLVVRRRTGTALRTGLVLLLLAVAGMSITGCSGKLPAQNPVYTGPGTYNFTVTATDGFLVHSATYSLTVTAK